ncbi:hypothetical protein TIFTF001_010828 [Ficus carica]|uniref:Uncharacterized protein n=1 Tax=Ficus carica TaxID=3494 RepID=A0AA87ZW47_FICCA|nr:hypothetical protein TIFTF001_010828 [Ficus carica]
MNLTRDWGKWEERWRDHEKLKKKGFKLKERRRRRKKRGEVESEEYDGVVSTSPPLKNIQALTFLSDFDCLFRGADLCLAVSFFRSFFSPFH